MIDNILNNPSEASWAAICKRPSDANLDLLKSVEVILENVKVNGDNALFQYAKQFDGFEGANFLVTAQEMDDAVAKVDVALKNAILQAKENITNFHKTQINNEAVVETLPGISCWRKSVGIEKVGLYIPGGTAPLFSTVLMLAIPAQLAGCKQIVICTPAKHNEPIHPAILFAAQICGVHQIYKLGGATAIAAMAYGTASISKVYKIFGPGNQYVTAAKQLVQQQGVAIDMPAGPSEVCVIADQSAVPAFVAADLLSQAEHGTDSQVMLVILPGFDVEALQNELSIQTNLLPRKEMVKATLSNSTIVQFNALHSAINFVNEYAAEHLIICCQSADDVANQIVNAGSVFIGNYSPESVGDYASGTNHTLPTSGYAKQYSGVSVDSFVKKITYQKLTKQGLSNIANTVITMAEAEQLQAHAYAVSVRLLN